MPVNFHLKSIKKTKDFIKKKDYSSSAAEMELSVVIDTMFITQQFGSRQVLTSFKFRHLATSLNHVCGRLHQKNDDTKNVLPSKYIWSRNYKSQTFKEFNEGFDMLEKLIVQEKESADYKKNIINLLSFYYNFENKIGQNEVDTSILIMDLYQRQVLRRSNDFIPKIGKHLAQSEDFKKLLETLPNHIENISIADQLDNYIGLLLLGVQETDSSMNHLFCNFYKTDSELGLSEVAKMAAIFRHKTRSDIPIKTIVLPKFKYLLKEQSIHNQGDCKNISLILQNGEDLDFESKVEASKQMLSDADQFKDIDLVLQMLNAVFSCGVLKWDNYKNKREIDPLFYLLKKYLIWLEPHSLPESNLKTLYHTCFIFAALRSMDVGPTYYINSVIKICTAQLLRVLHSEPAFFVEMDGVHILDCLEYLFNPKSGPNPMLLEFAPYIAWLLRSGHVCHTRTFFKACKFSIPLLGHIMPLEAKQRIWDFVLSVNASRTHHLAYVIEGALLAFVINKKAIGYADKMSRYPKDKQMLEEFSQKIFSEEYLAKIDQYLESLDKFWKKEMLVLFAALNKEVVLHRKHLNIPWISDHILDVDILNSFGVNKKLCLKETVPLSEVEVYLKSLLGGSAFLKSKVKGKYGVDIDFELYLNSTNEPMVSETVKRVDHSKKDVEKVAVHISRETVNEYLADDPEEVSMYNSVIIKDLKALGYRVELVQGHKWYALIFDYVDERKIEQKLKTDKNYESQKKKCTSCLGFDYVKNSIPKPVTMDTIYTLGDTYLFHEAEKEAINEKSNMESHY
ncbi:hypothetical protein KUTeg_016129 [Tegillarca granosa]|uniref:FAST kinase-like protein subdomain 2 domain-containing protein n=1 Tax=Tegillarca granosa TaxID=220873 RepID=A0ABQ9EJY2_TEGGR|nr:hypothetical protein KUTeg_016129 [Tegillarca granosa]